MIYSKSQKALVVKLDKKEKRKDYIVKSVNKNINSKITFQGILNLS